jgi:class 3 adenylate cyclase/DNA-binding response OmpR family regulator
MAKERILVADDHKENVQFIIDAVLTPHGFRPIVAYDGQEALRKAVEEKPDLILLDLQMPKMDGLTVLERLRVPVVLMTFHGSEEIAVRGFRLGARDYVIKPFTAQEMLTAIEGALLESRLRAERDALMARLMQANQQLERRLREMRTLYAVGQSVLSVLDTDVLLRRITDAVIYLLPQAGGLQIVAEGYRDRSESALWKLPAACIQRAQETLHAGKPAVTSEGDAGPTYAYIPLVLRDAALGVLIALWPAGVSRPDEHHLQLLSMLAGYAAIALHYVQDFENLQAEEEREKERIRQYFQMYVPPSVVERILSDPEAVQLGGVRREVSVLFADLQGFTALSERLAPEELINVLNQYLSVMARTVMAFEGTVDKFLGDGIMAIFGAPLPQADHAQRAAQAALGLRSAVARLHERLPAPLRLEIHIGIGTGEVVVGNVGTEQARNYTAIGDAVNVARRLQEMARPNQILLSEQTLHYIYDRAEVRALGPISMAGRRQELRVFELLDLRDA